MKNKLTSFWFVLVLVLMNPQLFAIIPDTVDLKQVEVKSGLIHLKSPGRHYKLDSMAMKGWHVSSLSEILRYNSPVYLKSGGPGLVSTASFRGTTANHTLVLWNGFPINGPQLGQVDFATIPVFFIDRIQLSTGNAGLERSSGIGGVVAIENTPDFNQSFALHATQSVGSFGSFGTYAAFTFGNGRLMLKSRFFKKTSKNDFSFINTAALPSHRMKQENASYIDQGFQQEFHYRFNRMMLSMVSWNQWNKHNLPPIMTNLERGGNPKEYQHDWFSRNMIRLNIPWQTGKAEFRSSFFAEKQHYYLQTTSAFPPFEPVSQIDSHNDIESWLSQLTVQQQIKKNSLLFSIHYDREKAISGGYREIVKREKFGMSAGFQRTINEFVELNFQARFDRYNKSNTGVNPFAELVYRPKSLSGLAISFSGGSISRYPTLNDLYWFPGGNPELIPERAITGNVSLNHEVVIRNVKIENKVSVYASDIHDWIQWRPTSYRYWVPENIARVFARGLEVQHKSMIKFNQVEVQLRGQYAFTRTTDQSPVAKIDHYSGKQLIYIPRHHGNIFINLGNGHWFAGSGLEMVGERKTSFSDGQEFYDFLPRYHLLHANAGIRLLDFQFEIKIHNLLDESYQAVMWRPMPGRSFEFVVSYQFKNAKEK